MGVADNALKPGAPAFLWHILARSGGNYAGRIVSVSEFAMPAEDWMAVCEYRPNKADRTAISLLDPLPSEVQQLEREANRARERASRPGAGGIALTEWAALAARMRQGLARLGISPPC